MAERRQFLDRLTPDVRAQVRQIGGDPDFVDFLLGWYGLLRMDPLVMEMASLKIKTWPYWSTTRQRQVKRELQERYGPAWKTKWEDIQARARSKAWFKKVRRVQDQWAEAFVGVILPPSLPVVRRLSTVPGHHGLVDFEESMIN
jgi:hypothetical protein